MDLKETFRELQGPHRVVRTDCEYATLAPVVGGVEVRRDAITMTWLQLVNRHQHRVDNDMPTNPVEEAALRRMNDYRKRSPTLTTLEKLGISF